MKNINKSRLFLLVFALLFIAACHNGDGGIATFTVKGTTGDAAAQTAISTGKSEGAGTPQSLIVTVYKMWLSENADCSDLKINKPVADYSDAPEEKDLATLPTLIEGSPDDGTYNCMVMQLSSVMKFIADETSAAIYDVCEAGVEHRFDLFRNGDTFKDINGTAVEGKGTIASPDSDDSYFVFASTDPSALLATQRASQYQILTLAKALTVPGEEYMIFNLQDKIYDESGTCWVNEPEVGFSEDGNIEDLRSWKTIGGGALYQNLVTDFDFAVLNPYGTVVSFFRNESDKLKMYQADVSSTEWSELSITTPEGATPTQTRIYPIGTEGDFLFGYLDVNDSNGGVIKKYNQSNNESTDVTYEIPDPPDFIDIQMCSDNQYAYYAGSYSDGSNYVAIFRANLEDSPLEFNPPTIEGEDATGLQIDGDLFSIDAYDGVIYLAIVLDGQLVVLRYPKIDGSQELEMIGEAMDIDADNLIYFQISARRGTIYLGYLTTEGSLAVASYNSTTDQWIAVGNLSSVDVAGGGFALDASWENPYILYHDADNSNFLTLRKFADGAWQPAGNGVIESGLYQSNTAIGGLKIFSGVPYVAYLNAAEEKAYIKRYTALSQ